MTSHCKADDNRGSPKGTHSLPKTYPKEWFDFFWESDLLHHQGEVEKIGERQLLDLDLSRGLRGEVKKGGIFVVTQSAVEREKTYK